jgi:iron complex outermembrane recepter protein
MSYCLLLGSDWRFQNFGLADSAFKDFSDGIGDYSGNKNPFSPRYTYSAGATYRNDLGIFATASIRGQDKSYSDKENVTVTKAFNLVDAKIGYEAEHFEVYVYADNLFDTVYDTNYGPVEFISPPREVGLQLRYTF